MRSSGCRAPNDALAGWLCYIFGGTRQNLRDVISGETTVIENGAFSDRFDAGRPFRHYPAGPFLVGEQLFGTEESMFRILSEKPLRNAEMLRRLRRLFARMSLVRLLGEQDRREAMRFFQKLISSPRGDCRRKVINFLAVRAFPAIC
jgi:hypothetical protein